ncbi:MAG: DUF4097 domain-containing protein [Turicibacter sp.]|nr:DUF4097 domain-containing protein [Turicibacter sp.]
MNLKKIILVAVIFVAAASIIGSSFGNRSHKGWDTAYNVEKVQSIQVESNVAQIWVRPIASNEILVHFTGQGRLNINDHLSNGQLTISETAQNSWRFSIGRVQNHTPQLEIMLPQASFERLSVSNDVGTILVEGIRAEDLQLTSRVGEITLRDTQSNHVLLGSNVGQINATHVAGNLGITSDMGQISISLPVLGQNIDVTSRIGEVNLNLGQAPENATIHTATQLGESRIFGESSTSATFGDGRYQVNISTNMGEINVW